MNKDFIPTWLYVKQHNKTGLKYFGKTIKEDPVAYKGSGLHWTRHLKVHGNDSTTVWAKRFDSKEELLEYAQRFSLDNNIVESPEWANMKIENGLDGWSPGQKFSSESRHKMSLSASKPKSDKWKKSASENRKGKATWNTGIPHSEETKRKMSESNAKAMLGKSHSDETRRLMSALRKGKSPSNKGVKLTEEQKAARRAKMELKKLL